MGRCDSLTAVLNIADNLPEGTDEAVLLHEIGHALADTLGIEWTEQNNSSLMAGLYSVMVESAKLNALQIEKVEKMR